MAIINNKEILPSCEKTQGPLYKNEKVRQNPDVRCKLLSVEEASSYLNVGRSTVYNLLNSKKIKAIKIGRRTLIILSSLDEFIEAQQDYEGEAYGF